MVTLKIVFDTENDEEYDMTINNYNDSLDETETIAELQKIVDSGCISPNGLISSVIKANIIKVTETEITV